MLRTALGLLGLVALPAPLTAQNDHLGPQRVVMLGIYHDGSAPPGGATQLLERFAEMMDEAAAWNAENSFDVDTQTSATTWVWDVFGWYSVPANMYPGADLGAAVADAIADGKTFAQGDRIILIKPSAGPEEQGAIQAPVLVPNQSFSVWFCWLYGNFTSFADLDDPDVRRAILHESAHTYGLNHARMESSINGFLRPYDNLNDVMGGEPSLSRHTQAAHKEWLGWMDPAFTVTPGPPGTSKVYTIAPLELPRGEVPGADEHALRIALGQSVKTPSVGELYYYIENRAKIGFDDTLDYNAADGALINRVVVPALAAPHSFGIDTTPETPAHQSSDCALMEGRSFFDPEVGVCITNLGKEGDNLRVEVNFVADFPLNRPPTLTNVSFVHDSGDDRIVTFSATGSDPDNDELSYFWDFRTDWPEPGAAYQQVTSNGGPPSYGAGAEVVYQFPNTGIPQRVRVKVFDRKGGESEWVELALWNWAPEIITLTPTGPMTIQEAIDVAGPGAIIELEGGSDYTGAGNRELRFRLSAEEPDIRKPLTVRAKPGHAPVIDCQLSGRAFVFDKEESIHSVVEGLTIKNGSKMGSDYEGKGGAIQIRASARPTIRNCVFEQNSAIEGGAIYFERVGRPRILGCTFTGNFASSVGGALYGRIALDPMPHQNVIPGGGAGGVLTLLDNRFRGNVALQGGALWLHEPVLTGAENRKEEPSGLRLANNEIVANVSGNSSTAGWAVYLSTLRGRALLAHNNISRNTCTFSSGGGLTIATLLGDDLQTPAIDSPTVLANTILWQNAPGDLGISSSHSWVQSGLLGLRHCLTTSAWIGPASNVGNVSGDPRFVAPDAPSYDFRLSEWQSPCVDAAEWQPRVRVDRTGAGRFDDPNVANDGGGALTYADMGPLERGEASLPYWTGTPSLVWNVRQSTQGGGTPSYQCSGQQIFVGADYGSVTMKCRAFLDFTLSTAISGQIQRVELDLPVFDGIDPWYAQVQTRAKSTVTAGQACDDEVNLWNSITNSTLYWGGPGFHQNGSVVRVDLGPNGANDVETLRAGGGVSFSLGVRAASESFENMMELYNYGYRLHVFYTP